MFFIMIAFEVLVMVHSDQIQHANYVCKCSLRECDVKIGLLTFYICLHYCCELYVLQSCFIFWL